MTETVVEVVEIGVRLTVERPRAADDLLDEDRFADDEFMPYWAELWPSGVALARHVATLDLAGRDVLELGCGLGLPSLAAALAGARVTALDWAADAIALLAENARRNGVAVERVCADWRAAGHLGGRAFDLVLAADVLYEERNTDPLLATIARVVAPSGRAVLADPGRQHAPAFLERIGAAGWTVTTTTDPLLPRGGIHLLDPE